MKQGCNGGLSAAAAAIHGQNPRSAVTSSVRIENDCSLEMALQNGLPMQAAIAYRLLPELNVSFPLMPEEK
jgi:hypothetical protein